MQVDAINVVHCTGQKGTRPYFADLQIWYAKESERNERKCTDILVFTFGDQVLGVEEDFVYLGISFDYKEQFLKRGIVLLTRPKRHCLQL